LGSSYYNIRNQEQIKNELDIHELTSFTAELLNYNDAINCMHADKCKQAMSEEVDIRYIKITFALWYKSRREQIL